MGPPLEKINYLYDRSLVSRVGREKTGIHREEKPNIAMRLADGLGRRPAYPQALARSGRPSGLAAALPWPRNRSGKAIRLWVYGWRRYFFPAFGRFSRRLA